MSDEPSMHTGRAERNFTVVPNGAIGADISASAFKVYVALRSYLRPGHATFPHVATVCEQYNIAPRTFAAALKELQAAGLLVINKRSYASGFRKANEYYFPDIPDLLHIGTADIAVPDTADSAVPGTADIAVPKEEEKLEEEKGFNGGLFEAPAAVENRGANLAPQVRRIALPLPDNFTVTAEMIEWAVANAPLVQASETEKFKDYHRAKGTRFKDWPAAWRNWMRNAQGYIERDRGAAGRGVPVTAGAGDKGYKLGLDYGDWK
jgi:hypothetical protein